MFHDYGLLLALWGDWGAMGIQTLPKDTDAQNSHLHFDIISGSCGCRRSSKHRSGFVLSCKKVLSMSSSLFGKWILECFWRSGTIWKQWACRLSKKTKNVILVTLILTPFRGHVAVQGSSKIALDFCYFFKGSFQGLLAYLGGQRAWQERHRKPFWSTLARQVEMWKPCSRVGGSVILKETGHPE